MNQMARIASAPADSFKARFTTAEFLRMIERGAFQDWNIELIDGELERMPPPGNDHSRLQISVIAALLGVVSRALVRGETGIILGDSTVLGCDGALLQVPVSGRQLLTPDNLRLVIEIAETTLSRDKGMKCLKYARAGIPEYWVVNGPESLVHVFRTPSHDGYRETAEIAFGQPIPVPGTDRTITLD